MTELEQALAENRQLRQELELLRQKLDYVIRQLYGSKSEKLDPGQLDQTRLSKVKIRPSGVVPHCGVAACEGDLPLFIGESKMIGESRSSFAESSFLSITEELKERNAELGNGWDGHGALISSIDSDQPAFQ